MNNNCRIQFFLMSKASVVIGYLCVESIQCNSEIYYDYMVGYNTYENCRWFRQISYIIWPYTYTIFSLMCVWHASAIWIFQILYYLDPWFSIGTTLRWIFQILCYLDTWSSFGTTIQWNEIRLDTSQKMGSSNDAVVHTVINFTSILKYFCQFLWCHYMMNVISSTNSTTCIKSPHRVWVGLKAIPYLPPNQCRFCGDTWLNLIN